MATVVFTPNLRRHVECPTEIVAGTTVREVLEAVFGANPRLRGYVLDGQGALRHHMNVFVDGEPVTRFAYDLVYRHALGLAPDGALAFGSTTGNVFASTDRGESWTCVSHHLPPVHAVTFA